MKQRNARNEQRDTAVVPRGGTWWRWAALAVGVLAIALLIVLAKEAFVTSVWKLIPVLPPGALIVTL